MNRRTIDLFNDLVGALDCVSDGALIIGFDWQCIYANEAACRHQQATRQQLLGRPIIEACPGLAEPPTDAALRASMADRLPRRLDRQVTYSDGSRAVFQLRVEPCTQGILIVSVDVTEQHGLQGQLLQAQKLAAVGKLAGGVAHDFNNLLTAIQGFTSFALGTVGETHAAATDLREVLSTLERASELTKQLLALSRQQVVTPSVVDVNGTVGSVEKLLARVLGEDVVVVTRLADEPWRTLVDPGALQQLLINLAVNARDAMPNGGALTLETQNISIDAPLALGRGQVVPAGDYIILTVSDDGIGMEPAILEQIFEPFFTTKPIGKGTGLGLSTCHGIARQANGFMWVYSEPGRGSTFKVYLPRASAPFDERKAFTAAAELRGGDETILLVEDDPRVRQVAERALAAVGYTVLGAASPVDATALIERHRGAVDLLLTDVIMPGAGGLELATRIRGRYPEVRVLYISGYSEAALWRQGIVPAAAAILSKPFTSAALVRRVRELLDGAKPPDEGDQAADVAQRPLVMVVDDDDLFRRSLQRQLTRLGYDAIIVADSEQAVEIACEVKPAVILLDLNMPGAHGHTLLRQLPAAGVQACVIVMSGAGNTDDVIGVLRSGAVDYLKKPWSTDDLAAALRRAVEAYQLFTSRP